jgi:hypothetical protein
MRLELLIESAREALVGSTGGNALLIQECEHPVRAALDQVQALLVVREGDERPGDGLTLVLGLLQLEDELVELWGKRAEPSLSHATETRSD